MGVNNLPKTVTGQRRDCDLNPGPSAPESSALATRLPSHLSKRSTGGGVYCAAIVHSCNVHPRFFIFRQYLLLQFQSTHGVCVG